MVPINLVINPRHSILTIWSHWCPYVHYIFQLHRWFPSESGAEVGLFFGEADSYRYLSFCWFSFCFGKSKPDYFRSCNSLLPYFCNPCDLLVFYKIQSWISTISEENFHTSNLGNPTLSNVAIYSQPFRYL